LQHILSVAVGSPISVSHKMKDVTRYTAGLVIALPAPVRFDWDHP